MRLLLLLPLLLPLLGLGLGLGLGVRHSIPVQVSGPVHCANTPPAPVGLCHRCRCVTVGASTYRRLGSGLESTRQGAFASFLCLSWYLGLRA
jgi:hypothetical protein